MSRKKKLLRADLERITNATARAESGTAAEIVTVIANQSGAYAGQLLLVSLAVMTAYSVLFFVFLGFVQKMLALWLWHVRPAQLLFAFLVGQAFFFGLTFALLSFIPSLRSAVVSRKDKTSRVRERAEAAFFHHNITATQAGNGLLLYVSLFEKRVELLVDAGIAGQVKTETWRDVVDEIIAGIRAGQLLPALEKAILRCGEILSGSFPRQPGDINELPDKPVVE